MNKDIVYIEPEEDITDIIGRIKNSDQKVVALVPPKKLSVLRSAINIKLIAKSAKKLEKAVVIVTSDPSIVKLAATSGIPVAKTLQSRPVVPTSFKEEEEERPSDNIETIADDSEDEEEPTPASGKAKSASTSASRSRSKPAKDADMELNSNDIDDDKDNKKSDKKKKSKIPNLDKYRKFIIAGGIALVAFIIFLVWAIGFSGAAEITVKIRTSSSSFAESVNFVTSESSVDNASGKIRLEKIEHTKESSTEFSPTGEKDVGNKASGTLTVTKALSDRGTLSIPEGTEFRTGNLVYKVTSGASANWDGMVSSCPELNGRECTITATVKVMAANSGDKYNIEARSKGSWTSSLSGVSAYNTSSFSGGTSEMVKVVTKDDVAKAQKDLETTDDGKEELLSKIGDDVIVIESSYSATTSDPVSSPAIDEKVSGDKAKLTAKTTYSIYVVAKSAVEEFIKASTSSSLGEDQRVYDIGKPFFERFVDNGGEATAKLKTTIKSGPTVTEEDVLEKSKGKKVSDVQTLLQAINGITKVEVKTPYPWTKTIPDNEDKITIKIEVEE